MPLREARSTRHCVALGAFVCSAGVNLACAATLLVGPGESIKTVAEAAALARDGDTVAIAPGTYARDVAVWTQKKLAIRGIGAAPVLESDGQVAEGKAIWVFRDGDYTVDNVVFTGARADDRNGAGIRFEKGRLVVRNCVFRDNENGILTANFADAELEIRDSEFSQAPRDRGSLKHLIYVGRIARFTMTGSRAHQGFGGHLVKSRARVSDLRYNLLYDGIGGSAAYEAEFPNGGAVTLVGNVIGQSATTTNPVVVAYGAEAMAWPENSLDLVHNTLVSDRLSGGWFLRVWEKNFSSGVLVRGVNNLTVGVGAFTLGASGSFDGNFAVLGAVLTDPATLDFTLGRHSWLRGAGVTPPRALAPTAEFRLPRGTRDIEAPAAWTPGAFQGADPRR